MVQTPMKQTVQAVSTLIANHPECVMGLEFAPMPYQCCGLCPIVLVPSIAARADPPRPESRLSN
jgi:hypothetical protein